MAHSHSMWQDKWMDIKKLTVAFRNFANAPTEQFRSFRVPSNVTVIVDDY
jgi:hypothetical protein